MLAGASRKHDHRSVKESRGFSKWQRCSVAGMFSLAAGKIFQKQVIVVAIIASSTRIRTVARNSAVMMLTTHIKLR